MIKELIIHSTPDGVDIALLENKQLVELHQERLNNQFVVGDVYLGKVKKVMPGLNAAFVNVGHEKDAFLHYTDLSPDIRSLMKFTGQTIAGSTPPEQMLNNFAIQQQIVKTGNVKEVLKSNTSLLVHTKGAYFHQRAPFNLRGFHSRAFFGAYPFQQHCWGFKKN